MSGNSESVIERVARAICLAQGHDPDSDWSEWKPNMPNPPPLAAWEQFRPEARAAIEAMRAPPNMHDGWGDGLNADYRLIWEVMIDAALSEDETAPVAHKC